MKKFRMIPSQNKDHEIQYDDAKDKRTWEVTKGRKSINELIREEINAEPATDAARKQALRSFYNV